jgi:hypothetical protein
MIVGSLVLLASLAGPAASSTELQAARDFGCTEWHDCRQLALAAADRGDYETFHNLAWRAVQTGPPKDPALMFLLARAQALSGRPHDALIMLQRLADMGVASDVAANDDFARTRELPGWPGRGLREKRLRRHRWQRRQRQRHQSPRHQCRRRRRLRPRPRLPQRR